MDRLDRRCYQVTPLEEVSSIVEEFDCAADFYGSPASLLIVCWLDEADTFGCLAGSLDTARHATAESDLVDRREQIYLGLMRSARTGDQARQLVGPSPGS